MAIPREFWLRAEASRSAVAARARSAPAAHAPRLPRQAAACMTASCTLLAAHTTYAVAAAIATLN